MSITMGDTVPGKAMAMGLVPKYLALPYKGATMAPLLVMEMPIMSWASASNE
jgi:hypothetical protein